MSDIHTRSAQVQFGVFEVDLQSRELRKQGLKVKVHGQPFQVLAMLLEHPGEAVTREEIRHKLWPQDTFVDFEHSVNSSVNKLREVLGDNASTPRFIETLPRHGYRFIAPVNHWTPEAAPWTEEENGNSARGASRRWVTGVVGGVVLILIAAGLWLRRPAEQPRVVGYQQLTMDRQLKGRGCENFRSRIVSDGARVYFAEKTAGLLQVSANGGDVVKVPNPLECFLVYALSPDKTELLGGAWAIESAPNPPLWALSPTSGQARRIGSLNGHAGAWSPDGRRIAYADGTKQEGPDELYIADKDGTNVKKILGIKRGRIGEIAWSPNGKVLRMAVWESMSGRVWEAAVDGSNLHAIEVPSIAGSYLNSMGWTADAKYFVLDVERSGSTGSIWALREKRWLWDRKLIQTIPITSEAMDFLFPALSPDGKKIFAVGGRARGELVRYDSKLAKLEPFLGGISAEHLDFSHDGKWVTYVTFPEGTLWKSRVDGSERVQLSTPPLRATLPKWSPDGTQIAFSGIWPGGHFELYIVSSGGGKAERVHQSAAEQVDEAWTADGNSLIFGGSVWANEKKILSLDLRTKEISSLPGSEGMFAPRLSPNDRYVVAYDMNHDARLALFDRKTQKWSVLTDGRLGGIQWSPDGRYLHFVAFKESQLVSFSRLRVADRKVETLGKSNLPEGAVGVFGPWMGLTPDGSPLLLRDLSVQEIYALDVNLP